MLSCEWYQALLHNTDILDMTLQGDPSGIAKIAINCYVSCLPDFFFFRNLNMETISELEVMHSNAGWYIGRWYTEEDHPNLPMPYSRESGYYSSEESARTALKMENLMRNW